MIFLKALWLILPAGVANMSPVLLKGLMPSWNTPVDFGFSIKGTALFGSHKTYRGLLSAVLAGLLTFLIQQKIYISVSWVRELSYFNYGDVTSFWGAWIGFCAIMGDLLKSLVKRRIGISPGKPWIPFDEIDWVVGALIGYSWLFSLEWDLILTCLVLGVGLHFVIRYSGYVFKLTSEPL